MEGNRERTTIHALVVGDGEKYIFRIRSIDLCGFYTLNKSLFHRWSQWH